MVQTERGYSSQVGNGSESQGWIQTFQGGGGLLQTFSFLDTFRMKKEKFTRVGFEPATSRLTCRRSMS